MKPSDITTSNQNQVTLNEGSAIEQAMQLLHSWGEQVPQGSVTVSKSAELMASQTALAESMAKLTGRELEFFKLHIIEGQPAAKSARACGMKTAGNFLASVKFKSMYGHWSRTQQLEHGVAASTIRESLLKAMQESANPAGENFSASGVASCAKSLMRLEGLDVREDKQAPVIRIVTGIDRGGEFIANDQIEAELIEHDLPHNPSFDDGVID